MLSPGEKVYYRFMQETSVHSARVICMKGDTVTLHISGEAPANIHSGQHVMVSNENLDFFYRGMFSGRCNTAIENDLEREA